MYKLLIIIAILLLMGITVFWQIGIFNKKEKFVFNKPARMGFDPTSKLEIKPSSDSCYMIPPFYFSKPHSKRMERAMLKYGAQYQKCPHCGKHLNLSSKNMTIRLLNRILEQNR